MPVRAIAFDAFGTLLNITERRNPYRQLLHWMQENGHHAQPGDMKRIMSQPGGLTETAALFGAMPPADLLAAWQADLQIELQSIHPFPDVLPMLACLKRAGYRIGMCSNLAEPYGVSVHALLPILDAYALSYQVGTTKPEPAIYQALIQQLGCTAAEVLFIGDRLSPDVEGPHAFGMYARRIDRAAGQTLDEVLAEILESTP